MAGKGLVSRTFGRMKRFHAIAPDIALRSLLDARLRMLANLEPEIDDLERRHAAAVKPRTQKEQLIEVLARDLDLERQVFQQIQESAKREILALVRLPIRVTGTGSNWLDEAERSALARGVHYRSIADQSFLESPGGANAVIQGIAAGDDIRIYPDLPFKMLLVDNRIALIPLTPEEEECPLLLVRARSLLNALRTLFELLWAKSVALNEDKPRACQGSSALNGNEPLVKMLASGMNDKAIQCELGISASTLNRRIRHLMRHSGARSRYQLGWIMARGRERSLETHQV